MSYTEQRTSRASNTERLFKIALGVKGADGGIQLLGALLLIIVPPTVISGLANTLITRDLLGDPNGGIAKHLQTAASHFADGSSRWFAIIYLLLHGVIKLGLVLALLRKILPAYPIGITVLTAFVVYEIWRAVHSGSIALPVFATIDIVIIVMVAREYLQLRRESVRQH